ncbi:MAG: indolepyruvate ferredoxin oxidoreductase [Candidatus Latescibacteria bacterium]|nr:indolepyruvate ferredoxin oxidoreductase [Candidatus Latescibacterota bacterium]
MDPRFIQDRGTGIFTGNELIVKGALESGVGAITGYPGSPLAELFDTLANIKDLLNEHGIVAQIANNEALAAARLNGSQMDAIRAMAVMKSVGLHVAADGLALGNMAGAAANGGALVAVGDDTWSEGTQVPADSRFLSQHLYMPVLEPATFQEIKDWVGQGFELSAATALYITYLVTSNQADGGGSVDVQANHYPAINRLQPRTIDTSTIASDERVIIPPATTLKEREVVEQRFPLLLKLARQRRLSRILYAADYAAPLGFITSGLAYTYLEHALQLMGLSGRFPILKLGFTYPLDTELLAEFAGNAQQLCVVEEKRPFLEPQIAAGLIQLRQTGRIGETPLWGKRFPGDQEGFPSVMGLHPSLLVEHLERLLITLPDAPQPARTPPAPARGALNVPGRTPSFCPGCPHRDSASVLQKTAVDFADPEYMKQTGRPVTDLVFHGDIGCYSMLKYEPFSRLMHNLSGMGLGGGTGAGIDPFIDNKQVVFMGDSTFFHTGITAISDSIKNAQDITYIILDNKTTAMTGHQPTPGVDVDILGKPTFAQDIEHVVRGLAGQSQIFIGRMDPSDRRPYQELVQDALLRDGVKILIADKECGITYHRRERAIRAKQTAAQGFSPTEHHINISQDVCEYCLECTKGTGCSGLTVKAETDYGPKIAIDLSACVADGACTKVEVGSGDKTCPSFEEITIHRRQPPRIDLPSIEVGDLPHPQISPLGEAWYTYIAGVGGMGINVVASVLAQAGVRQGYEVRLTNKKGLAIRNGSVYSHLSYAPKGTTISPLTPQGQANLLLGLDLLEAARGVDPQGRHQIANTQTTAAVINTAKTPTIDVLIGSDDYDTSDLTQAIRQCTHEEAFFGADLFHLCESYLGNKLYANVMMLGIAYQRGLLPLELENLEWALKVAVRRDFETNQKAFAMGRRLALDPHYFDRAQAPQTLAGLIEEKTTLLDGKGQRYQQQVEDTLATMDLPPDSARHFALRVYDLIQYENFAYAQAYIDQVQKIYAQDRAQWERAATQAVIRCLAKVMVIKDEVYVAHLLTAPEKYARDRVRYNIDPKRGDRLEYRHFTRPNFRLLGRDIRFDVKTRDWQLGLMAKMKFLRRLFGSWWHREERDFITWYSDLLQRFDYSNEEEYRRWVQVLSLPEEVRGYRGVRDPKMAAAKIRAQTLLSGQPAPPAPGTLHIEPAVNP